MGVGGWGGFGVKPLLSGAKGHFVGCLLYLHAAGRAEDKDDASPRLLLPLSEALARYLRPAGGKFNYTEPRTVHRGGGGGGVSGD